MWPYWLLFLIPAYFSIMRLKPIIPFAQKAHKGRWPIEWWGIFVLLVLMIGFRHEVGGDWQTYIENLDVIADSTSGLEFNGADPGFAIFYWLAIKTGLGIYLVNILSATIFTWGLTVFCRAQPRPWLALAVAVPYLITVVAMGYTRQGVAIGVAMVGMVELGRSSTLRFVFWMALAAAFHKSAVILIPLALLVRTDRSSFTFILVIVAGIGLYVLTLRDSVDFLILGYIEQNYESSGAAIRIAMNAVPATLFLIFRKRFQLNTTQNALWSWMAWSALLLVVLLKISPSSTAVDRVALYWIPLQLFVLSRLPNALGKRNGRNAAWVCVVVAYSAAVHFVWLLYADTAFAWLPYQFYPLVWLWR
jgi:hypothetical protein